MSISPTHICRRSRCNIIALSLTLIYLIILLSPLISLATNSKNGAFATTRECTGDCNLCGCSLESRASNTCCCSKKRQQRNRLYEEDKGGTSGCCKNKPVKKQTVIACGCPCGSETQGAAITTELFVVLPLHIMEQPNFPYIASSRIFQHFLLISRHAEPPDPPPKLV